MPKIIAFLDLIENRVVKINFILPAKGAKKTEIYYFFLFSCISRHFAGKVS